MSDGLVCNNCGKHFVFAAKQITSKEAFSTSGISEVLENYVCPFCLSIDIDVGKEESKQVEAVYIYELTVGNQEKLNALLADGFQIVNRFSKQYHLEKPKATVEVSS